MFKDKDFKTFEHKISRNYFSLKVKRQKLQFCDLSQPLYLNHIRHEGNKHNW